MPSHARVARKGPPLPAFRNRRGERVEAAAFTATDAKKQFARILETGPPWRARSCPHQARCAEGHPPLRTRSGRSSARSRRPPHSTLDTLTAEFDALYARMQTPEARRPACRRRSTPRRPLGRAAVPRPRRSVADVADSLADSTSSPGRTGRARAASRGAMLRQAARRVLQPRRSRAPDPRAHPRLTQERREQRRLAPGQAPAGARDRRARPLRVRDDARRHDDHGILAAGGRQPGIEVRDLVRRASSSPELHIARVRARVARGGHDIPEAGSAALRREPAQPDPPAPEADAAPGLRQQRRGRPPGRRRAFATADPPHGRGRIGDACGSGGHARVGEADRGGRPEARGDGSAAAEQVFHRVAVAGEQALDPSRDRCGPIRTRWRCRRPGPRCARRRCGGGRPRGRRGG